MPVKPKPKPTSLWKEFVAMMIQAIGVMLSFSPIGPIGSNLVTQGLNMLAGFQDKFDWKSLGIAVVTAGVQKFLPMVMKGLPLSTQAASAGAHTIKNSLPIAAAELAKAAPSLTSHFIQAAATTIAVEGIATATGLQKSFSWANVAAAAVGVGIGGIAGRVSGNLGFGQLVGIGAGAGAKTLIDGSSFGDNLMSSLPSIISGTIGMVAEMRAQELYRSKSETELPLETEIPSLDVLLPSISRVESGALFQSEFLQGSGSDDFEFLGKLNTSLLESEIQGNLRYFEGPEEVARVNLIVDLPETALHGFHVSSGPGSGRIYYPDEVGNWFVVGIEGTHDPFPFGQRALTFSDDLQEVCQVSPSGKPGCLPYAQAFADATFVGKMDGLYVLAPDHKAAISSIVANARFDALMRDVGPSIYDLDFSSPRNWSEYSQRIQADDDGRLFRVIETDQGSVIQRGPPILRAWDGVHWNQVRAENEAFLDMLRNSPTGALAYGGARTLGADEELARVWGNSGAVAGALLSSRSAARADKPVGVYTFDRNSYEGLSGPPRGIAYSARAPVGRLTPDLNGSSREIRFVDGAHPRNAPGEVYGRSYRKRRKPSLPTPLRPEDDPTSTRPRPTEGTTEGPRFRGRNLALGSLGGVAGVLNEQMDHINWIRNKGIVSLKAKYDSMYWGKGIQSGIYQQFASPDGGVISVSSTIYPDEHNTTFLNLPVVVGQDRWVMIQTWGGVTTWTGGDGRLRPMSELKTMMPSGPSTSESLRLFLWKQIPSVMRQFEPSQDRRSR